MVYKRVIFHCHLCTFPTPSISILLGSPRPLDPSKTMLVPFPAVLRLENVACRESLLRRNLIRCLIFLFMYIYIYIIYIIYMCVLYYIYNVQMYVCMYVCVCDTFIFLQFAYILNMCPFAFVWVCVSPTSRTCALEKCVFVCVCVGGHMLSTWICTYISAVPCFKCGSKPCNKNNKWENSMNSIIPNYMYAFILSRLDRSRSRKYQLYESQKNIPLHTKYQVYIILHTYQCHRLFVS